MLVPPTATGDLTGEVLEGVTLIRDEGANLVWGIARLVKGPAGQPMDRATLTSRPAVDGAGTDDAATDAVASTPLNYETQSWRYRPEADVPPSFCIPFLPERITERGAQVRLRRARMQQWSTSASKPESTSPPPAGACGTILDPGRPCWSREEEVPRSGIRVDRRWRCARGDDGRGHLWLQLEKTPAGGERSSGVRWDVIEIGA